MKDRLALCSAFSQAELSVSALFMHEILEKLKMRFEVVCFSEEPEQNPIHNLFLADQKSSFQYSLTFSEDRPGCVNYRFFPISVPGVQVLIDANFDRLYFEFPWQFKDLSKVSLLRQMVEGSTAVAGMNEHALSNVRGLNLFDEQSIFGLQVPVRKLSLEEERFIEEQSQTGQFTISYSARYFNEERTHEVIDCLLELEKGGANAKLLWISRKGDTENVRRFLEIESARRQVQLTSLVEQVEVVNFAEERRALCRADLFLSLRKDFLHSPPTAFFHALALGIPTVATELGPMTGVPKESVLFVPAGKGEGEGILTAVNAVRENQELRMKLSSQAKAYADLVHNPELVAADLIAILEFSKKRKPDALEKARRRSLELENNLR